MKPKNRIKSLRLFFAATAVWLMLALGPAAADTLLDVTSAVTAADPTQLNRLSRDGKASTWSSQKAFPGINGGTFHYHTFSLFNATMNGSSGHDGINSRYVQVLVDDANSAVFVSAYLDAYIPDPFATNGGLDVTYIGDAGSTSYFSGTDAASLQIFVPPGHSLVVVVNEIAPNTGTDKPFRLLVEGFTDTLYTDTRPGILSVTSSNTDLVLNATNCIAGRTYEVLMSTNLALPLNQWAPIATNVPVQSGQFQLTVTNVVNAIDRQRYFTLQSPLN